MTITPVRAARWDTSIERGGAWKRVLRRRTLDEPQLLAAPCTMTIYATLPSSTAAGAEVLSVNGVVAADGQSATFTISDTASQGLAAGRYQHKVTVTDPNLGLLVLLRGYLTVYDGVEG